MQEHQLIKKGRMEQSIDNLSEWINKCTPSEDRELISILYQKLENLKIKIDYIKNQQE